MCLQGKKFKGGRNKIFLDHTLPPVSVSVCLSWIYSEYKKPVGVHVD